MAYFEPIITSCMMMMIMSSLPSNSRRSGTPTKQHWVCIMSVLPANLQQLLEAVLSGPESVIQLTFRSMLYFYNEVIMREHLLLCSE